MSKQKSDIPAGESKEEKFRRVIAPRIKNVVKSLDRVAGMPLQPSYAISENDGKQVLAFIKKSYDKLVDNYKRAIAGTLKAKEIKEYTGIDWDAELIDEEEGV